MGPATQQFITRPISLADNKRLEKALKRFDDSNPSPAISLLENLSRLKVLPREKMLFIRQLREMHGVRDKDTLLLAQIILCHQSFPYSCRKEYLLAVHHWLEGEIGELYKEFDEKNEKQQAALGKEAFFLLKEWDEALKKKDWLQPFQVAYPQVLSEYLESDTEVKNALLFSKGDFIISQGDLNFKNRLKRLVEKKMKATTAPRDGENNSPSPELTISGQTLSNEQSLAVSSSLANPLTLITGGPGTGKTTTIAAIISHFMSQKPSAEKKKMALAAPTGKAANRMLETLSQINDLSTLDIQVSTLHQLLKLNRRRDTPKFNKNNPLNCDLVILDESSMVNLKLMVWLLEALLPHAKLILMGDSKQLPAIDGSAPFHEMEGWVKGQKQIHFHLTQTHRFTSHISDLVEAMDTDRIEEVFLTKTSYIKRLSPDSIVTDGELIKTFSERSAIKVKTIKSLTEFRNQAKEGEEILGQLSKFIFLTASKMGFWGSDYLNQVFSGYLGKGSRYYEGQPILILENNYSSNLFNGDRGVILRSDEADSENNLFALFRGNTAEAPYRLFSLGQLPRHETSYAMTIHKSQGSEFKEVVLCLTEVGRLDVSRELLYTGITRAKSNLTIIANEGVLSKAAKKTVFAHN